MNNASPTLPADIVANIASRFHPSRHATLAIELDEKGRPGFWNWDKSSFIACSESIETMREEMRNPPRHTPEDAQGLGLLSE
jgi:hypothetical protein